MTKDIQARLNIYINKNAQWIISLYLCGITHDKTLSGLEQYKKLPDDLKPKVFYKQQLIRDYLNPNKRLFKYDSSVMQGFYWYIQEYTVLLPESIGLGIYVENQLKINNRVKRRI